MIDALLARPTIVRIGTKEFRCRRPTVADFIAVLDAESRGEYLPALYVANHLIDENGERMFTPETARNLHGPSVVILSRQIEVLYTEGLD